MDSWYRILRLRLRALFRSGEKESELEREIQFHLENQVEENLREGMDPETARKEALKEFGGMEKYMEDTRDSWGVRVISDLIRDIRYSMRSLWKSKGFSFAVVATLALCVGGNTTILSVLYDLVLKPLPFENPDRIVKIHNVDNAGLKENSHVGWGQYLDFADQATRFEGFALVSLANRSLDDVPVEVSRVTSNFLDLMGERPIMGRFFTEEEVAAGPRNVVVLTQSTWENDYSAARDIIGKEIAFNNAPPATIVGVAPKEVEVFDPYAKYFLPFVPNYIPGRGFARGHPNSDLWARLKPGVSRDMAYDELVAIERRHMEERTNYDYNNRWFQYPKPIEVDPPHPLKGSLGLLQFGTLFLVAVGCVNILNLLVSRTLRRQAELSVRRSLGAKSLTLIRLMVIESVLLSGVGVALGCSLAWIGLTAVNRYLLILFPKVAPVSLSGAVLLWTLLFALVVALVMGLVPIGMLLRSRRIQKMDTSMRSASASAQSRMLGSGLVVLQVAITFTLIIGAGLIVKSFKNVLEVDPGFDAAQVVSGGINLRSVYRDEGSWLGVRKRILEEVRKVAGIESVSYDYNRSVVQSSIPKHRVTARAGLSNGEHQVNPVIMHVGLDFFKTMGIALLDGRTFQSGDHIYQKGYRISGTLRTTYVVDQNFADQYLVDQLVVGAQMVEGDPPPTEEGWGRIVGLAERANLEGLENRDATPVFYNFDETRPMWSFSLLARTKRSPESVILAIQEQIRKVHPDLQLRNPTLLSEPLGRLHLDRQGFTLLISIFACLALFLSTLGIYGVISYDVQQRWREIGIRTAVGASRMRVMTLVLRQGIGKAGIGLGIGFLISLYLSRFLESSLFDVTSLDTVTYISGTALVVGVALIASYIPARRAVRIDPIQSIQVE